MQVMDYTQVFYTENGKGYQVSLNYWRDQGRITPENAETTEDRGTRVSIHSRVWCGPVVFFEFNTLCCVSTRLHRLRIKANFKWPSWEKVVSYMWLYSCVWYGGMNVRYPSPLTSTILLAHRSIYYLIYFIYKYGSLPVLSATNEPSWATPWRHIQNTHTYRHRVGTYHYSRT